jgi:hypothetical protein
MKLGLSYYGEHRSRKLEFYDEYLFLILFANAVKIEGV